MEKKLNELSKEEKIELLKFWVAKYSSIEISSALLEELHKLIELKTDDIMNVAILDFLVGAGSSPLVLGYRNDKAELLINKSREQIEAAEHDEQEKGLLEAATTDFLKFIGEEYEKSKNPNTEEKNKKFQELSKEEIIELLKHWLVYYGKTMIFQEELEQLHHLIETRTDEVLKLAVLLYDLGEGSTLLIEENRSGNLERAFNLVAETMKEINNNPEARESAENVREKFIEEITNTYKNPEPANPMPMEQIIRKLREMGIIGDAGATTDISMEEKVARLFVICGFKKEELEGYNPLVPYIIVEGIQDNYAFSADRINSHKDQIYELIDQLPGVDYGASFTDLCMTKDGKQWTESSWRAEQLMLLGLASDILVYTLPEECWKAIGGVPKVTRVCSNKEKKVIGKEPGTFEETVKQIIKRRKEFH